MFMFREIIVENKYKLNNKLCITFSDSKCGNKSRNIFVHYDFNIEPHDCADYPTTSTIAYLFDTFLYTLIGLTVRRTKCQ